VGWYAAFHVPIPVSYYINISEFVRIKPLLTKILKRSESQLSPIMAVGRKRFLRKRAKVTKDRSERKIDRLVGILKKKGFNTKDKRFRRTLATIIAERLRFQNDKKREGKMPNQARAYRDDVVAKIGKHISGDPRIRGDPVYRHLHGERRSWKAIFRMKRNVPKEKKRAERQLERIDADLESISSRRMTEDRYKSLEKKAILSTIDRYLGELKNR